MPGLNPLRIASGGTSCVDVSSIGVSPSSKSALIQIHSFMVGCKLFQAQEQKPDCLAIQQGASPFG